MCGMEDCGIDGKNAWALAKLAVKMGIAALAELVVETGFGGTAGGIGAGIGGTTWWLKRASVGIGGRVWRASVFILIVCSITRTKKAFALDKVHRHNDDLAPSRHKIQTGNSPSPNAACHIYSLPYIQLAIYIYNLPSYIQIAIYTTCHIYRAWYTLFAVVVAATSASVLLPDDAKAVDDATCWSCWLLVPVAGARDADDTSIGVQ